MALRKGYIGEIREFVTWNTWTGGKVFHVESLSGLPLCQVLWVLSYLEIRKYPAGGNRTSGKRNSRGKAAGALWSFPARNGQTASFGILSGKNDENAY